MKLPVKPDEPSRDFFRTWIVIRDADGMEVCRVKMTYRMSDDNRVLYESMSAFRQRAQLIADRLNGIGGKVDVHG